MEAGFHVARRGFLALSVEVTDQDVDRYVDAVGAWASDVGSAADPPGVAGAR